MLEPEFEFLATSYHILGVCCWGMVIVLLTNLSPSPFLLSNRTDAQIQTTFLLVSYTHWHLLQVIVVVFLYHVYGSSGCWNHVIKVVLFTL